MEYFTKIYIQLFTALRIILITARVLIQFNIIRILTSTKKKNSDSWVLNNFNNIKYNNKIKRSYNNYTW